MMLSDEELIPQSELLTPLRKARELYERSISTGKCDPETTNYAILVSTGSYSPVHYMHLQIFETARKKLESEGYVVIGGFISPSHDQHVIAKLGPAYLPAGLRCELCTIATEKTDIVEVSRWESECPGFVDFPRVTRSIGEFIKKELGIPRFTAFYLCGADLVLRCRLYYGGRSFGVVGIARPGWEVPPEAAEHIKASQETQRSDKEGDKKQFFFVEGESADVSSTKIRRLMEEKNIEELNKLTYPEIVSILMTRDLNSLRAQADAVRAEQERALLSPGRPPRLIVTVTPQTSSSRRNCNIM